MAFHGNQIIIDLDELSVVLSVGLSCCFGQRMIEAGGIQVGRQGFHSLTGSGLLATVQVVAPS